MDYKEIIEMIENKKRIEYAGRKYYYYKPNNQPSNIDTYQNNRSYTFKQDNNQEVYTNWFKVLVNQKIDYSLVKPVTVDKNIPIEFNIEDIVDKSALNASLDSKSWLYTYINNKGLLDWVCVPDAQIIDKWDEYNKYITCIIRFWELTEDKNKTNEEKITYVEIWDDKVYISFYYVNGKKEPYGIQQRSHYQLTKGNTTTSQSFGFIPFIPLFNNKNKESDIESIQVLLDTYNEISTGFINNVRKFQEMLMKLKGYIGDTNELKKVMKQLQELKMISIGDGGDAEYMKVDIPVEARSVLLNICKENIFILGRGVDPTFDFGGSNITNVLIKSKYANLDMKNSDMEKQIRLFYKQLINRLNTYYRLNLSDEITFNRTQIFNESEQIDNCLKSMGLVSNETVLTNHPWVTDIQKELKTLEKEKQENMEEFNQQLEQNKEIDFSNKNKESDKIA